MDQRFVPINALLAMVTGEAGWPPVFKGAGYHVQAIEAKISTSTPAGDGRTSRPDAVLANPDAASVILGEAKSGSSGVARQLETMSFVTVAQARTHVGFSFVPTRLESLVIGLDGHEPGLRSRMAEAGVDFPLLLLGGRRARLTSALHALEPFDLEVPAHPPRIICIDAQSSEDEWRRYLAPQIAALMAQDARSPVGVDSMIQQIIAWWPTYSAAGKRDLCHKVQQVLRGMQEGAMAGDFALEEPHGGSTCGFIRILRTPATNDPHGVTQGWQRVRRNARGAMGRRERAEQSMMDPLFRFEELGLAAEVDTDRPGSEDES